MSNPFNDLDLDLDNYSLNDILDLFNLNTNFTAVELKEAYKQVLYTHPDKSNLDKKYFLFFSKAFKILKQIYDYTTKYNNSCVSTSNDYNNTLQESITERNVEQKEKHIYELLNKFDDTKQFNSWFNEHFEKVRLYNPEKDGGHGEWLKTEDNNEQNATNIRDMHNLIIEKKEQQRSLIKHKHYNDMVINSGNNVNTADYYDPHQIHSKEQDYSSGFNDKFKFNDLKKAYTESVIPVTENDYINREKYTVNQMKNIRNEQVDTTLNKEEYNRINQNKQDNNCHKAYMYIRQQEQAKKAQDTWNAYLYRLTNT